MKKLIFGLVFLGLSLVIYLTIVNNLSTRNLVMPLISPWGSEKDPVSNEIPVAPPVSPKTFKFDRSTNLKAELEKVNPEIFDSDFE